jgi:protein-tyrosine-phosphatase
MRAVARTRDISVAEHSSRVLNEAMLRDSDVVVLFEPQNFVAPSHAFPQYLDKVLMLGAVLQPPRSSIDDPCQRSLAETEHIGRRSTRAWASWRNALACRYRTQDNESAPQPAHPLPGWCPGWCPGR